MWKANVSSITSLTMMHDVNAVQIDGFGVSCGMVRMTRIAHTAATAARLRSGKLLGREQSRLRVKLCLHAQFPRMQRAWIENRLRRALTRKGCRPNSGLDALCRAEDLFARAKKIGARDIEIVVITSPVIETGNDLDFDYAIVDPISIRSIVQSAGRVRRHRPAANTQPVNIFILGRSPVAMQIGALEHPGVETPPHRKTNVINVGREHLKCIEHRLFRSLAGDAEDGQPLGKYLNHLNARLNLAITRSRMFRRSVAGDILYQMRGEDIETPEWHRNLSPGSRYNAFQPASELSVSSENQSGKLFGNSFQAAWIAYTERVGFEPSAEDLRVLMQVQVPDYGNADGFEPAMTWSDFTGFTRGQKEDLFASFGKTDANQ